MVCFLFLFVVSAPPDDLSQTQAKRYLGSCAEYATMLKMEIKRIKDVSGPKAPAVHLLLDRIKGYPSRGVVPVVEIAYPSGRGLIQDGDFGAIASSVKVVQIIGVDEMLVEMPSKQWLWIKGRGTTNLVEGQLARPSTVYLFEAVGQKQYTTVLGTSKTVVMLEAREARTILREATALLAESLEAEKRNQEYNRENKREAVKRLTSPANPEDKIKAEVHLKMGAARSKMSVNDPVGAQRFAEEAVKASEGTDLHDQAIKLLNEIKYPQR